MLDSQPRYSPQKVCIVDCGMGVLNYLRDCPTIRSTPIDGLVDAAILRVQGIAAFAPHPRAITTGSLNP